MHQITRVKVSFLVTLCASIFIPTQSFAENDAKIASDKIVAVTAPQIFEKAKKNEDWKNAFLTGKNEQIVFMSVSPSTNPANEIGMETHKFDQVIFIAEGKAKTVLNDKSSTVEAGDLIFIPQGTAHNVINLNEKKRILSIFDGRSA